MARWRSSAVALVALGAAAGVSGCSPQPEYRRNGYASRADCLRDYPAHQCESTRSGGGFYYYGPWYGDRRGATATDPGPGATAVDGRSQVADPARSATRRGGFGRASGSHGG